MTTLLHITLLALLMPILATGMAICIFYISEIFDFFIREILDKKY